MLLRSGIRDLQEQLAGRFDIIAEFSALTPRRKVLLCEQLYIEGQSVFFSTVELLWPQSKKQDAEQLEKFLYSLRERMR